MKKVDVLTFAEDGGHELTEKQRVMLLMFFENRELAFPYDDDVKKVLKIVGDYTEYLQD